MNEGLYVFHQRLVEAPSVLHAVAAVSQRKSRLFLRLVCVFAQGFLFRAKAKRAALCVSQCRIHLGWKK